MATVSARKDGSLFRNQLHLSAIENDAGDVAYYFASQIDVTAFRKVQTLQASEHRLLIEVDHRAKGVLVAVDSIVRLSRSDDAASYSASVQQRVQALSMAHGLLAERGWHRIRLRDVVGRQVDRYKARGVDLTAPDIAVSAVIVQPLALVFHELATNAAVHGALSKPAGRLSLSWEKTDNQGGFCMT
jgi:two-component sensor histidine kinase